jgi:hypothetical protein
MIKGNKQKAAVHSVFKRASNGFLTRWLETVVIIVNNPYGPRGGSTGIWVEGRIDRRFKTRDEALKYVEDLRKAGKVA